MVVSSVHGIERLCSINLRGYEGHLASQEELVVLLSYDDILKRKT